MQVTYSIKRGAEPGSGELHTKMEVTYVADSSTAEKKNVPSPVNLTNHAYWNLSGNRKRSVREHDLMLRCDRYLPLDDNQVRWHAARTVRGRWRTK